MEFLHFRLNISTDLATLKKEQPLHAAQVKNQ